MAATNSFDDRFSFDSDMSTGEGKEKLINTMRNEAENLRIELRNAQENCHKLQRDIEKESEERLKLKKRASALAKEMIEKEKSKHQNEISDLKAQLFEQKKLAESQRKSDDERVKSVESELNKRFDELHKLENVNLSLTVELDQIRQKKDEYQESIGRQKQEYENDISMLRTQLSEKEKLCEDVERKREEAIQRMLTLESDLDDRDKELRDLHTQIASMKVEKERLDLQNTIASAKAEKEKKDKEYLPCDEIRRRRWLESSVELRKVRTELDGIVTEKKALQDAWMDLDKQFEDVTKLKDSYQTKTGLLEKEVLELKETISRMQAQYDELKIKYRTQIDDVKHAMTHMEQTEDQKKKLLEKETSELKATISKMQAQYDEMIGKYRAQIDDVKHAMKTEQNENQKTKLLEKEKLELKETISRTQAQYDELKIKYRTQIDDVKHTMNHMEQNKDQKTKLLEKEISELKETISMMQAHYDEMKIKYRAQIDDTEHAMNHMQQNEDQKTKLLEKEISQLKDKIFFLISEQKAAEANYREHLDALMQRANNEGGVSQRYIDELAELTQSKEDLAIRLRSTEEHLGEVRRDYRFMQEQFSGIEMKYEQSEEAYKKIYSSMHEAMAKISAYKNEKEYFEKLYNSYKERTQTELMQKDSKIAQQDKLITHLQCRISAPKKGCCFSVGKEPAGRLSMDDLGKALDLERSKNVDLKCTVRRLQDQLAEKRMRRSFSEERLPVVKEN